MSPCIHIYVYVTKIVSHKRSTNIAHICHLAIYRCIKEIEDGCEVVTFVHSETSLNQTLNKMESCINQP